jgi:hypothetical protein
MSYNRGEAWSFIAWSYWWPSGYMCNYDWSKMASHIMQFSSHKSLLAVSAAWG